MRSLFHSPLIALVGAVLLLGGCAIEPQPILLGSEECDHCRMVITERGFASQALTRTGKAHTFDAIECLVSWVITREEGESGGESLHSLWVTDVSDGETWIEAEDAHFLRSETLRSPMGLNLSAYADVGVARMQREAFGGEILDWEGVLRLVRMDDMPGEPGGHGGHSHVH